MDNLTPSAVSEDFIKDPVSFVQEEAPGVSSLNLMVENVHCAGCINKIERNLNEMPGIVRARVNMSTRRLRVDWRTGEAEGKSIMRKVSDMGYPVAPFDPAQLMSGSSAEGKSLLIALAVAGFAAGNVMLLSVSIWAGAFSDMGVATRDLFHWISALIAMPAIVFAGRPFFKSAYSALKASSLNMDVPISLAVVLAGCLSLYQTAASQEHAYFDASVTLLFFLLIGRYLDHQARAKARSAAEHLLTLSATAATVIDENDKLQTLPISEIVTGMTVIVVAGERIPVDGMVIEGRSDVDTSLVTGETLPKSVNERSEVYAGTLNVSGPLTLCVTAVAQDTLLAEIVRLMEAAEQGRAKYVRIADRVARFYAPAVHILAAGTFLGWWLLVGATWQTSLITAIAVLIITCPCALGLAVPVVQVVANGMLLRKGVLVKKADALERLAAADMIVFDKTGTLTLGRPILKNRSEITDQDIGIAASMARHSKHPLSRAIAQETDSQEIKFDDLTEVPGCGLEAYRDGLRIRLGNRDWCGVEAGDDADDTTELWLVPKGDTPVRFSFEDQLRSDALGAIGELKSKGYGIELLSGDIESVVEGVAEKLNIGQWRARCKPDEKLARLQELADQGHKVIMVGDGLNDAPALAAGFASISPAQAADVSQTAADVIFQGENLGAVNTVLRTARLADRLVKQNFGLAFLYNAIAIPIAVIGLATPLVAAVAMSSSSLIVTLNAFRLRLSR